MLKKTYMIFISFFTLRNAQIYTLWNGVLVVITKSLSSEQLKQLLVIYYSGKKDIFYYDLGGTFCMCEWKWDVGAYWSKVHIYFFTFY